MKYHDNPAIVLIDDQPFGGSTEPAANLDTQTFTRLTLKVKVRLKGSNTKVIVTIYEGDQDEAAPDHQATVQEETSGTGEVTVRAKTFAINTIADGTAETLKVAVAASRVRVKATGDAPASGNSAVTVEAIRGYGE